MSSHVVAGSSTVSGSRSARCCFVNVAERCSHFRTVPVKRICDASFPFRGAAGVVVADFHPRWIRHASASFANAASHACRFPDFRIEIGFLPLAGSWPRFSVSQFSAKIRISEDCFCGRTSRAGSDCYSALRAFLVPFSSASISCWLSTCSVIRSRMRIAFSSSCRNCLASATVNTSRPSSLGGVDEFSHRRGQRFVLVTEFFETVVHAFAVSPDCGTKNCKSSAAFFPATSAAMRSNFGDVRRSAKKLSADRFAAAPGIDPARNPAANRNRLHAVPVAQMLDSE